MTFWLGVVVTVWSTVVHFQDQQLAGSGRPEIAARPTQTNPQQLDVSQLCSSKNFSFKMDRESLVYKAKLAEQGTLE
jgi:hypothetical protein